MKNRVNRHYREWVSRQPCAICGAAPCDPHHYRIGTGGGMGVKPHDKFCLPLCHHHHVQAHQVGARTFWHGHEPTEMCAKLNQRYAKETGREI